MAIEIIEQKVVVLTIVLFELIDVIIDIGLI